MAINFLLSIPTAKKIFENLALSILQIQRIIFFFEFSVDSQFPTSMRTQTVDSQFPTSMRTQTVDSQFPTFMRTQTVDSQFPTSMRTQTVDGTD